MPSGLVHSPSMLLKEEFSACLKVASVAVIGVRVGWWCLVWGGGCKVLGDGSYWWG